MEEILHQAEQLENEYDWSGAAELYEKALNLLPEDDSSRKGETHEQLGYAFYRFAFQAESNDEFRQRLRQAILNYEKAKEHFQKPNEPTKTGKILRCDAMIAYMGYWLASEVPEKKRLLNECWRLTEESLKVFEGVEEASQYGRTYNQLSSSIVFAFCLEWNFQAREKLIREAVEHGERTIKFLSSSEYPSELARAYARTAFYLGVFAYSFLDVTEKETGCQKARDTWARAKEISENVALSEMTWPVFGPTEVLLGGAATDEALKNLGDALEYGKKTKDKFSIGCALDWLAYHTAWKRYMTEDPDEIQRLTETAMQYAEDAKQHFLPISFISPRADYFWIEAVDADHFRFLASNETDMKKKQALLEKAIVAAREGLKRAESSGYIEAIIYEHHISSFTLLDVAELEKRTQEKRAILQQAMKHREEGAKMVEQVQPFGYWNRGWMQASLARIKYRLAELSKDTPEEKNIIQEAVLDLENALRFCTTELALVSESAPPLHSQLGGSQYRLGIWLGRLYEITNDRECLRKAVKAFGDAVEAYQIINLVSRVAECQWKTATTYDLLGEHLKAAENFTLASDNYKNAVEKIPQLKSLYQDHASYMLAWTEIEKARHHHERQEYDLAREHFMKTANIHKSLKQWSYLASNYFAWMQVEDAEDLSRKERIDEAIDDFKQADNLFNEAKKSLETQLSKIEDSDEKQMAAGLVKATDVRQEYCMARIALEQARKMDKEGDHYSSSEKYGSAAEAFEKISESAESDQERKEMKFTVNLSRAWQKMTLAEAKSSPALYMEASQLFEQTEDLSPNEKTKMLVLGHSRFCRALETGTKYVDTRDPAMHAAAVQQLASASTYYIKADFQNASEYAKATKLLFDAYAYMDNAESESDPDKKAKLYTMVEKVLQTSAGSFTKAEHPEKREQVLKLLEKAKEERELATSLTEVLHAPSIISTTRVLTAPTQTHEEAVGSERFEYADVQANLIVHQRELIVGEDLKLEIELVNAGRGPAVLVKLSDIIPTGFELVDKPEIYRVEDSYLDMKGKRLDALKPEEINITLKPKNQGIFQLKPRISYLDEKSKYRFYELEPVSITVKELGIKGWLKGER